MGGGEAECRANSTRESARRIELYNRAIRILSLCRERDGEIMTRYTYELHATSTRGLF